MATTRRGFLAATGLATLEATTTDADDRLARHGRRLARLLRGPESARGIADAYLMMANGGIQAPVTIFPQAKAEALRAVELDPELAEAYTSYGFALAVDDCAPNPV